MVRRFWPWAAVMAGIVILALGIIDLNQVQPVPNYALQYPLPDPIISPGEFPTPDASPTAAVEPGPRIFVREIHIDLPVVPGDGHIPPLYKAAIDPRLGKSPGEGGRSLVYAHARFGMFGPLFRGAVGQHVDYEKADGTILHYVITQYYAHWPATDLKWLHPSNKEELVLLTCTTYNPADPRIIAVAEPL